MKPHRLIRFALLSLLLFPFAVLGQGDDSQVILFLGTFAEDNSTISGDLLMLSLSNASIEPIPLSPQLFSAGGTTMFMNISPDHHYFAVASQMLSAETANPVAIYDLQSNSCCVYVEPPMNDIAMYTLGGFSPDSSRLALSWIGFHDRNTYDWAGGILTVDAATGTPAQSLTMEQASTALNLGYEAPFATLGSWRQDGIRFIPNCYACEPQFEGEWAIWEPDTNVLSPGSGEYFSFSFGEMLLTTGESIYAGQSPQFPVSQEPAFLPIPNVVYYTQSGPMPTFNQVSNAPVIFYDENQVDLSGYAHWVLDGQAVLVTPYATDGWTLLFRDGSRQDVFIPPTSTFLAGTPNGWLALVDDPNGSVLTLYTVEGAEVLGTPLSIALPDNQYLRVIDAPELGASVTTLGGFASVQPLFPPLSASGTCPNLLPTRLTVNTTARVTPGDPNRLRADPTTNGAIVGEIPGGAEFYIINGPICDDANGIVWWQVGYNNLVGWTAESLGDTYFVEPVGVG